jgi:hypothetical protein
MKPKGHKAKAQRQKIKADLAEEWASELNGLRGAARDKKECELLNIEYGKPWKNVLAYFRSELEKGYHDYIDTLMVFEPLDRWRIFEALHTLMEVSSQEGFKMKKTKARITLLELKAELQAVAKEPAKDQLKIVQALPFLWQKFGCWSDLCEADERSVAYHGKSSTANEAKKKLQEAIYAFHADKREREKNENDHETQRERSLDVDEAHRLAVADDKGHTAPLVPEPAWLLRRAKEQVPEAGLPLGNIWDVVRVDRENERTWPSMHDMVMGLGWPREKIEAEIKAQTAGWDIPPDTGRRKPGKAKRYSPEVLRWLIGRWLKQRHADLKPDELKHVTDFLRQIQSRLPG